MTATASSELPVPREEARRDIVLCVILSVITCGIHNVYWNYREMKTINGLLGRQELSFATWLIISILTLGIFHVYYEYKMGLALQEVQVKYGRPKDENLALVSLLLSIFGLTIVADAVQQHHINKLYDQTV